MNAVSAVTLSEVTGYLFCGLFIAVALLIALNEGRRKH
jgi:hypothetical protein